MLDFIIIENEYFLNSKLGHINFLFCEYRKAGEMLDLIYA